MTQQPPDPWAQQPQQPYHQPQQYGPPGQWQQQPQPPPRRKSRAPVLIGLLATCGLLFAGCVALVVASSPGTTGGQGTTKIVDQAADSRSAAAEPEGESKAETAKLGQPARDGQFEFTVRKVDCSKTKLGDTYLNTRAQGVFCQVSVRVANIGDEPRTFASANQKGFDKAGREYTPDDEAAIYLGDRAKSLYEEINPGNRVNGIIVFDVPRGTRLVKVELHDDVLSGGVEVNLAA